MLALEKLAHRIFNRELVSAVLKVCLLGIQHFYFSEVSTFQMVSKSKQMATKVPMVTNVPMVTKVLSRFWLHMKYGLVFTNNQFYWSLNYFYLSFEGVNFQAFEAGKICKINDGLLNEIKCSV